MNLRITTFSKSTLFAAALLWLLAIATPVHAGTLIGTFNPAADMGTARASHTATLLSNGKVLVAGGTNFLDATLPSAQIYDPATGTWTATGGMSTARFYHTATLLPNGKVLLVGGIDNSTTLSSAEIYDPATGTCAATGSMGSARVHHTATLLPNGKVLVAGGQDTGGSVLSNAEIYDPATGTWAATGGMTSAREGPTATLLPNGKVLLVGGLNGSAGYLSSAEIFDPATGTWVATGGMTSARYFHTATLLSTGKVLVAGGMGVYTSYLSSVEIYDPATGTWAATGGMSSARYIHTATLLPNGEVLVAGGYNGNYLSSVEIYNPLTGTWAAASGMSNARANFTATPLPSGLVLVAGGDMTAGSILSSAELFDYRIGAWAAIGGMSSTRENHTATLLPDGKVLVAGLTNDSSQSSAEIYDPARGSWAATGGMSSTRFCHTATLLPNGKVLVSGGASSSGVLSSAEIYDPATETWTPTGDMTSARSFHTATLLPNGKVLVAGGSSSSDLASAEIYDPATGTWAATGGMSSARNGHTATLLPSGKVLVVGGSSGSSLFSSAEIYDPATGTWAVTGGMNSARIDHTATLLPSGKVLVAGGYSTGSTFLSSTEIYDPATGSWTATGSMNNARENHTATLLPDGKLLVAGGANSSVLASVEIYDPATGAWAAAEGLSSARYSHTATLLPSGQVLVAGGSATFYADSTLANAELFTYATGSWAATGSISSSRSYHTATLLPNGKVLVAGGYNASSYYLSSAELYDPTAGTWVGIGDLSSARGNHTATLLPNGKVLIAGGLGNYNNGLVSGVVGVNGLDLASAELYDPSTGAWAATGGMHSVRANHTATLLPNGKVLVAGGLAADGTGLASAEIYDPATGAWTATGGLSSGRFNHTATLLSNGKVLVAAGYNGSAYLWSAEIYDPATGIWTATGTMRSTRAYHTATLLPNGKVLVAGGENGAGSVSGAEIYDPATGTWAATGGMNNARENHTATLLPDGKVLVAGGSGDSSLSSAEIYDPSTGSWRATGSMSSARDGHTATLLPSAKVLVAGGYNGNYLASAEIYGTDVQPFAQPQISYATPKLVAGSSLILTGWNFDGLSGGSCGNSQDSPTNYPLVQLRSLDSGVTKFVPWDSTANPTSGFFQSAPLSGFPQGYAYVTVFAGGTPGVSALVDFVPPVALSSVTIASSNSNSAYAKPGDTVTVSFTSTDSIAKPVLVIAGQNAVVTALGGNSYQASITVTTSTPAGPASIFIEALGAGGFSVGPVTATTDGSHVTIGDDSYQVLAVRNGALPGSQGTRVFASFGTPEAGSFGGTYVGTTPSKAKPATAIFGANGNVVFDAFGARWAFYQPTGDALLATIYGITTLYTGLESGRIRPVAGTTANPSGSSVSIKKILSVDGNGTATFFLATLQGKGVTPANATALESVVNGTAHIVARQGDTVSIDGTTKKVTTLTTFAASPGTAADGRWRVDDNTFGIRVTFADKSQALYEVPATATSSADWTLVAETTNLAALSGLAAGFGLPSFSGTTQAVLATLPGKQGKAVVNLASNTVLTQINAIAYGPSISSADTVFKSLSDPVCGSGGQLAFLGVISGTGVNAHNNTGIWYAADGTTPKLIARTGDVATGGGHWARFTSLVMPGAPAFVGTLALNRAEGVTAKNNTGLWASDADGTVHLLFRTGQTLLVEGIARTVTSFTALAPAAGSIGAASGYSATTGEIPVLANFQDGTQALLNVYMP